VAIVVKPTLWLHTDHMQDARELTFRGRCTAEQKALWERAARASKRTLSDWLRVIADEAAEKVLAEEGKGKKR